MLTLDPKTLNLNEIPPKRVSSMASLRLSSASCGACGLRHSVMIGFNRVSGLGFRCRLPQCPKTTGSKLSTLHPQNTTSLPL